MRLLLLIAPLAFSCSAADVLRDIPSLKNALEDSSRRDDAFSFDAIVTVPPGCTSRTFSVDDGTNGVRISDWTLHPEQRMRPGDRIRLSGYLYWQADDADLPQSAYNHTCTTNIVILSRGIPPEPNSVLIRDLFDTRLVDRRIRIVGEVLDAFRDDSDVRFVFLVLADGANDIAYVHTERFTPGDCSYFKLIGAQLAVTGLCLRERNRLAKRKIGISVSATGDQALEVLHPPPSNPFAVPELGLTALTACRPSAAGEPVRRRVTGRVLAVWRRNHALVRRANGDVAHLTVAEEIPPPRCGETIEAVGIPETDLYHMNLSRVIWRHTAEPFAEEPDALPLESAQLLTDGNGHRQVNAEYHGRAIRIRGTVADSPSDLKGEVRFHLDCDGFLIPVDCSALPAAADGIEKGCTAEIAGTCVFETANWRPQAPFPKIESFLIVPRTTADVILLARPPWWTPFRFIVAIGLLLFALAFILVWNVSLRKLATRKSRELFKEQLGHVKADLRTEERTRLAVELHDTLAQNLTGVSMEIEAANDLRGNAPQPMLDHLGIAAKALKSCRDELRNCLWDLRSQALEETDMTQAILRTLQPCVADSRLAVRFEVPRSHLSDNTAHALLRVIRELVVNAIRHGEATSVKVAGTIDGDRLLCSVTDDGTGFDPDSAPGVLQGHFGLQGIRERLDELGGEFVLESTPGSGTKARISLTIPHS